MGLLDNIKNLPANIQAGLLSQYSEGAPYRQAVMGLLQGDTQPANTLFNTPHPADPMEAVNIATGLSPMALGTIKTTGLVNAIKQLEANNKSTLPKIPASRIFNNDVGALDTPLRMKADEGFATNNVSVQPIKIADIVPTQKNVTTGNIKSVEGVTELPELIKSKGKYYISDGHHRIARDILNGLDTINAKIFE